MCRQLHLGKRPKAKEPQLAMFSFRANILLMTEDHELVDADVIGRRHFVRFELEQLNVQQKSSVRAVVISVEHVPSALVYNLWARILQTLIVTRSDVERLEEKRDDDPPKVIGAEFLSFDRVSYELCREYFDKLTLVEFPYISLEQA